MARPAYQVLDEKSPFMDSVESPSIENITPPVSVAFSLRRFSIALTCMCLVLWTHLSFGFGSPYDGINRSHHKHGHDTVPPEFVGPIATGRPPSLRESNPAPFPDVPYIPNDPLETQEPILGNEKSDQESIFRLHGQLSHYFPNPSGFGVDEFPLPSGSKISQLHTLSRHGARYPPHDSHVAVLGRKLEQAAADGEIEASDEFAFLNSYIYPLGQEILVPIGKQELFQSGILHYYQYGHLYQPGHKKVVVRSTTQHRMTESSKYFLAGFFGLDWEEKVDLELIIEATGYNNTLAGYWACPNCHPSKGWAYLGNEGRQEWMKVYLADALERFKKNVPAIEWTIRDIHDAQSLCAYETVAVGFSHFCALFNYEEWKGYEYGVDIEFAGNLGFQSPVGRVIGIGWVQEFLARLEKRYITEPTAQVNVTLTNNPHTFPLDQSLYLDFSHDASLMSILTALNLRQFSTFLPTDKIVPHDLVVSHLSPFGARLDIEVIEAPFPVSASRKSVLTSHDGTAAVVDDQEYVMSGSPTKYIHFILNQRTIPLGKSLPACGDRDDGWCELEAFLSTQRDSLADSDFDYSCFGDYGKFEYGDLQDGVPLRRG